MSNADRAYLERILDDTRKERRPELRKDKYFEVFSAEQILKKYDPRDEEIDSGRIGMGGDGGIDSIYCFVDRFLLREDTSVAPFKKGQGVSVELVVIQSKSGSGSFDATVIEKLVSSATDLLDVSVPLSKVAKHYNKNLISIVGKFRDSYLNLAKQKPVLVINFYYACLGQEVHPDVEHKKTMLIKKVKELFPRAFVDLTFVGAQALLDRYAQTPSKERELSVPKVMASGDGYVCLVPLKNFFAFITDEKL